MGKRSASRWLILDSTIKMTLRSNERRVGPSVGCNWKQRHSRLVYGFTCRAFIGTANVELQTRNCFAFATVFCNVTQH